MRDFTPAHLFSSLPIRVVLGVIILVFLTVILVGLPAIQQSTAELERQSANRVASGAQVIALLIEAEKAKLSQASLLAANRPTLQNSLAVNPIATTALFNYLETLRLGLGVDRLWLCGPSKVFTAQGDPSSFYDTIEMEKACQNREEYFLIEGLVAPPNPAWLVAQEIISNLPADAGEWRMLSAQRLDDTLAKEFSNQAGLDLLLLVNDRPVAASQDFLTENLPDDVLHNMKIEAPRTDSAPAIFLLHLKTTSIPGLEVAAALNLADSENASQKITWRIFLGMAVAAAVGSFVGAWAAWGITRPLENLRRAAEGLRRGDLFTPVNTKTTLREIMQVAFALEEARAALQHSLYQLQQEKEWNTHLLDSIVEGIITLDRTGRVMFISPGALRITGLRVDQVTGRPLTDVLPALGLAELLDRAAEIETGQPPLTRLTFRRPGKEESERTLSITTARLQAPIAGSLALVVRDVTEDERLHRLTGDFLANITHEFRTPLSALGAATELLIDQARDENASPDITNMLADLRLSILNLQTLIDNLLEGASLESGRFRISPQKANLEAILESAVATMRPLVEKYGQKIKAELVGETTKFVWVDPVRTRQALSNLLANAARFGIEGGIVQIRAELTDDSQQVKILVHDQGPGLPGDEVGSERLFQRFGHLSDAGGRSEAGAGIGLSIVKAIVEAQGGRTGAANHPAGGAVFWFTVPLAEQIHSQKALPPSGKTHQEEL